MPFVETIPKKVWKQHLATLKGMTLQSERTFKYTATAEQLHQVDDRWLGEGGTILLSPLPPPPPPPPPSPPA